MSTDYKCHKKEEEEKLSALKIALTHRYINLKRPEEDQESHKKQYWQNEDQ